MFKFSLYLTMLLIDKTHATPSATGTTINSKPITDKHIEAAVAQRIIIVSTGSNNLIRTS